MTLRRDLPTFEQWKAAGSPQEPGVFRAASGSLVNVLTPSADQVRLEDIARSLSRQCRFGGHLAPHVEIYSVAQHSVFVSYAVPHDLALVGLLHDAAETFLQDLIKPNKLVLATNLYQTLEREWAWSIGQVFGVGSVLCELPEAVKLADRRALATEQRDLVLHATWDCDPYPQVITPLDLPSQSYQLFMDRFRELIGVHPRAQVT
jgi:hypothetical protein